MGDAISVSPFVLQYVEQACARRAQAMQVELGRGLSGLKAVASTAALVGLLGTAFGIESSFTSYGTSRSTILAFITNRIAYSLIPALLGLLISIAASVAYGILLTRLEAFAVEMQHESSRLTDSLLLMLRRSGNTEVIYVDSRKPKTHRWSLLTPGCPRPAIDILWNRIYRHGVLELLWPRLTTAFDVDSALRRGMWVSLGLGLAAWFGYWSQGRRLSGLIVALFFILSAFPLGTGSRFALMRLTAFCLFAAAVCLLSFGTTLSFFCIAAAPFLLSGAAKALFFPHKRSVAPKKGGAMLPFAANRAIEILGLSSMLAVLAGTVFLVYPLDEFSSMQPAVEPGDWIVTLHAPFLPEIRAGDVVDISGWEGITRVAGLPGDRIHITSGQLFRNGKPVLEPYITNVTAGPAEDFPLPAEAYADELARWYRQNAYRDNLGTGEDVTVPAGSYFLLNDNRHNVRDSRVIGPAPRSYVRGAPLLSFNSGELLRLPRRLR